MLQVVQQPNRATTPPPFAVTARAEAGSHADGGWVVGAAGGAVSMTELDRQHPAHRRNNQWPDFCVRDAADAGPC